MAFTIHYICIETKQRKEQYVADSTYALCLGTALHTAFEMTKPGETWQVLRITP